MNWYVVGNDLYCEEVFVRVEEKTRADFDEKQSDTRKRYFKSNEGHTVPGKTSNNCITKRTEYHVGIIETDINKILHNIKIRTELGWVKIGFSGVASYYDYKDPIDMLKDSPDVIKVVRVYEQSRRTEELYNFYMNLFKENYSVHFAFAPCCKSGEDYCYIVVLKPGFLVENY